MKPPLPRRGIELRRAGWAISGLVAVLSGVPEFVGCRHASARERENDNFANLIALDEWTCVFGSQNVVFRYGGKRPQPKVTHVDWQLMVDGRVVARGAEKPGMVANEEVEFVAVPVVIPPVNPGVIVSAKLNLTFHIAGAGQVRRQRNVVMFPADPFVGRSEWLRQLEIQLFDPSGTTATAFDGSGIPFTLIRGLSSVGDMTGAILIVGEGLNWEDHKELAFAVRRAATRGATVLCLAPAAGTMPLYEETPDASSDLISMTFAREDVIQQFDDRFDTREWRGGPSVVSAFSLESDGGQMVARVADSTAGWPWLELRCRDPNLEAGTGQLFVCGFGIIEHWEEGPVPRFLFSRILETLLTPEPDQTRKMIHAKF